MSGTLFYKGKSTKRRQRVDPDELVKFRQQKHEEFIKEAMSYITPEEAKYVADKADALFTDEPPTPRNRK